MTTVRRVGDAVVAKGVVEEAFLVGDVPGLLWTPEGSEGPRPLVLMGHGATLDKRVGYLASLARRLVRHHGISAAAIDLPGHGERMVGGMPDVVSMWTKSEVTEQAVGEWQAVLSALDAEGLGQAGLGYWGLSMGTLLGLPFVAAEPRIQVAVLGLAGVVGPPAARLTADAPRITCPVLFLQQWEDELFPRESVLALFDLLGSLDKRLHVHPGLHSAVPLEEIDASESFLALHLLATAAVAR
ncbi:MAG TPA: hypothetical protein VM938_14535 [Acidimicrobiales bacterium]|nr:hypothetical protein [Acidimicrobiales bacterium]